MIVDAIRITITIDSDSMILICKTVSFVVMCFTTVGVIKALKGK